MLGGKATERLIQRLAEGVPQTPHASIGQTTLTKIITLAHCLADEAAASPGTIRTALRNLIPYFDPGSLRSDYYHLSVTLTQGRYGADLREEARDAFLATPPTADSSGTALCDCIWYQYVAGKELDYEATARYFAELLKRSERLPRLEGALGAMRLCYEIAAIGNNTTFDLHEIQPALIVYLDQIGNLLANLLYEDLVQEQYAASWALAWLGNCQVWAPPIDPDMLSRLFELWQSGSSTLVARKAVWALASQRLESRDSVKRFATVSRDQISQLLCQFEQIRRFDKTAALIVAYHIKDVWNDARLIEIAKSEAFSTDRSFTKILLNLLGASDNNSSVANVPKQKRFRKSKDQTDTQPDEHPNII